MDIHEGGTSIPYWLEDPEVRSEFERQLNANGAKSKMEPHRYVKPEGLIDTSDHHHH
jgi:hypothetical protein